MDITKYFEKPTKKKQTDEDKLIKRRKLLFVKLISEMVSDQYIDLLEYTHLTNFSKSGGTLTDLGRFKQIVQKIQSSNYAKKDIFDKLCNKMFEHLCSLFDDNNQFNGEPVLNGIIEYNKNNIAFTDEQKQGIKLICDFLYRPEKISFGLYGYAGSGKTTVITNLVNYLVLRNYVKRVVFAGPTRKALNVMKSKFRNGMENLIKEKLGIDCRDYTVNEQLACLEELDIKIDFLTIHSLLGYKNDVDVDGQLMFVKGRNSSISNYDLVVVDECSMIPLNIIIDIFEDIRDHIKKLGNDEVVRKVPKVVFAGDPSQLPPVSEKLSVIFAQNERDFDINLFKQLTPDKSNKEIVSRMTNLQKDILAQETITFENVVRTDDDKVVGLSNEIRRWVISDIPPNIGKYKGEKVHLYKYDSSTKKTDTVWFKKCLKYSKTTNKSVSNIILTWTNHQTAVYNGMVRQKLFNKTKLNNFERGDILILNDFYNIKETNNAKRFYTSEQIRVTDLENVIKAVEPFTSAFNLGRVDNGTSRYITDKIRKTISVINKKTIRKYKVWKLYVKRLTDDINKDKITETFQIYVIDNESVEQLDKDSAFAAEQIKELRNLLIGQLIDKITLIDNKVVKPLWKELNKRFVDPFAKVNYAGSITTHKAQGSTYYNTFIDIHDIFKNNNSNEVRRCIYTAITRTSNEVHLLI